MRKIIQWRWPILIGMIVLTAALFMLAPNLTEQAEEAGSFQLPADADSQRAADILAQVGAGEETISLVYTLDKTLNDSARQSIADSVTSLQKIGEPITGVLNPFESEEMESQLVSEDEKTVLVPVTVEGTQEEINMIADDIRANVLPDNLTAYVTGEAIINNDVNTSSQEGLKRTELITVGLIFVLLLTVFRSIVTPLIPLAAVGFTYLLSQSLVAFFIDWFGFPVSNYTQIFLVAVLFGIGTDYCILLLSRYKEELQAGHSVEDSIVNTYKTAGRTLLISGIAVFIGFSAIGFADFPIFKSAVGVAVGIAILLIVLFTIVPFFMVTLKEKLFWPSKKSASHNDSKLWAWFSKLSVNRPLLSMLVVALITVPLLFTYDGELSFNTVDEIGNEYESVKGLDAISEGFGKGDSLPVTVIMSGEKDLVTEETVPYVEAISQEILKVDGVEAVRTITRPTGEAIDELYVDTQLGLLTDGLVEARNGLLDVQDGLAEIQNGLSQVEGQLPAGSEASSGAEGLQQAADGISQINEQLGLISGGMQQSGSTAQAAAQIGAVQQQLTQAGQGINTAAGELEGTTGQISELGGGLAQLASGVGEANNGLGEIAGGLTSAAQTTRVMSQSASVRDTGMYIPDGTLENEEFADVLDRYTINDQKGIKLEVFLTEDPYSTEAIDIVEQVKNTVQTAVIDTPFEQSEFAYSGISSVNSDLKTISSNDFSRTVIIMLVSLLVALTLLFRSVMMPLYMIGSLLLTYYTSVAVAELIFVNGLGYDGVSWAVPFFGFVMLVALGIDYSIFLLDRFREEAVDGVSIQRAMTVSMAKMGTVIITAAIILAGTFGAMMPSGVLSLVQISTIVLTGLLLYGLIVLPLLIPAVTVSFNQGVWWPFKRK
ncbi:MMPL family transporter [Domibacillus sp. A3M-37]|uniref:MMPL family transporter n=1 Tax=Domibacillus sp. A3M-37 TaxID=2962037 RepID=UPI0020B6B772|nr:MMPL family transporter [Domibacillus sp. A3M-37]MCP3763461.1 MMPL family transporter [Domibacillus sp. A3M-37]